MGTLWFCIVSFMFAAYVILDGFDFGVGILHRFVARNDAERRAVLAAIGPFWDGNEVWLIGAAGVLYFAFPAVYASALSGFYLAMMLLLWLLMLRGLSIELRNHVRDELWQQFWDLVFGAASALLALFFGAAIGNVVRGVPIDHGGYFFVALWTNFLPGANPGILDWFTVLMGLAALAILTVHGALWLAYKTEGDVQARSRSVAAAGWWLVALAMIAVTAASFAVQPHILDNLRRHVWIAVFPAVALAALVTIRVCLRRGSDGRAFVGSGALIAGLMGSAAAGMYPILLPATSAAGSLTISNSASSAYGLSVGLVWWIPAAILAVLYVIFVQRLFRGKVTAR